MRLPFQILTFFLINTIRASISSTQFDSREATIDGIHNALFNGLNSCRDVISSFIARIEAINPTINAVLTLNPNALDIADDLDIQIASGNATGALLCVPVLLKDNYDTADMNTTGGSLALAGSQPSYDAPTVTAMKRAGAIMLGKVNLHELALEGISVSSLGGQTFNPYDQTRTPGGSSGGTGAAIGANFAIFGTGTDTVNSLRSPASANSLFSIRPTWGLISRAGVIPISYTQDTLGPIARTLKDLATALTVMASVGYDKKDNATAQIPISSVGLDYSKDIYGGTLKGLRLGVLEGFFNRTSSNETTPVNDAMNNTLEVLRAAGALLIPINETIYNATAIGTQDIQRSEFREAMDVYLSDPSLKGTHPESLADLYSSGEFVVLPSGYNYVKTSLISSTSNASYAVQQLAIKNLSTTLLTTFTVNRLDAIVYPEQKNLVVKVGSPSQSGRNGILAALTGFPVITVPAGFSNSSNTAPNGIPIGMEILGLPWSESKLFNIAARLDDRIHVRRMPALGNGTIEVGHYDEVPTIIPNRLTIPGAYPVGSLG